MKQYSNFDEWERDEAVSTIKGFIFAFIICTIFWGIILVAGCKIVQAETKTYDDLANAIFWAEGGTSASKPYGIFLRNCTWNDPELCRSYCLNTIRNNTKRFINQTKHDDFLSFLASRYAPVGAENDPNNLNKNWLKNVKWFLDNPKPVNYNKGAE